MPVADKMDFQRCLEILELDDAPSLVEIRQAYKDMVNVWHPDRFIHNPRLREKAEKKLKEINAAYQLLVSEWQMGSKQPEPPLGDLRKSKNQEKAKGSPKPSSYLPRTGKTELAVELGTRAVLTVCYSLYKAFNHVVADLEAKAEREAAAEGQKPKKR